MTAGFLQVEYNAYLNSPFPPLKIGVGESSDFSAICCYAECSTLFYVQLPEYADIISSLNGKLHAIYSKLPEGVFALDAKPGYICAARSSLDQDEDAAWYRARCVSISPSGEVMVQYLDYGNCDLVDARCVKVLDPQLMKIPAQAIACSAFAPFDMTLESCIDRIVDKKLSLHIKVTENSTHTVSIAVETAGSALIEHSVVKAVAYVHDGPMFLALRNYLRLPQDMLELGRKSLERNVSTPASALTSTIFGSSADQQLAIAQLQNGDGVASSTDSSLPTSSATDSHFALPASSPLNHATVVSSCTTSSILSHSVAQQPAVSALLLDPLPSSRASVTSNLNSHNQTLVSATHFHDLSSHTSVMSSFNLPNSQCGVSTNSLMNGCVLRTSEPVLSDAGATSFHESGPTLYNGTQVSALTRTVSATIGASQGPSVPTLLDYLHLSSGANSAHYVPSELPSTRTSVADVPSYHQILPSNASVIQRSSAATVVEPTALNLDTGLSVFSLPSYGRGRNLMKRQAPEAPGRAVILSAPSAVPVVDSSSASIAANCSTSLAETVVSRGGPFSFSDIYASCGNPAAVVSASDAQKVNALGYRPAGKQYMNLIGQRTPEHIKQLISNHGKHPIMLIHEYATQRKLNVDIVETDCFGPPGSQVFIFHAVIGDREFPNAADLNKKSAKYKAAENAIEVLFAENLLTEQSFA